MWLLNDWDSSDGNYLADTGELLAQGVDVTLKKPLWVEKGKLKMGAGTLTLEQGGELGEDGELDLTGSTLELTGPFYNNKGKGTLTTSASTLSLKSNVKFEPGNDVTFSTYEPNGWGMVLHNDMDNNSATTHLTLGTNGVDLLLQPNTEALTSGFVNYYSRENGAVFSTNNHAIGIKSYEVELTINGNLTLKDNATILGYEEDISLGNLTLENGNIASIMGTMSLAGGSVGENGMIYLAYMSNLDLQGDLTVAGALNLGHGSSLSLAGNTLDVSGGELGIQSPQKLDGITTDNATTLKINQWAQAFRTDNGTTTVGNLEMVQDQNPDDNSSNHGTHFGVDNMSLIVAGNVQIEQGNIELKNGTLTLQQTVSADNASIIVKNSGELILQDGLSFSNGNLYLENSVFKPKGSVLLADSGYGLNNSTTELQGDTTFSRNGSVGFTVLDLNGNTPVSYTHLTLPTTPYV